MRSPRSLITAVLVATFLFGTTASAAVPPQMSYQVMLTDDSDNPLVEQSVEVVFDLYNTASRGRALWTETHNVQTNAIGVVSVILGKTTALTTVDFDQPLWLELTVDGTTLLPRRELSAAPYAMHAADASELGGTAANAYLTEAEAGASGAINTPSNPLDWTMLKNVPAGIADGDDATGGAGDGHSLDASDGSPVDAVYVDAAGDVGIGTTSPNYDVHFHRSGGALNYLLMTNGTTGTSVLDGLQIGINGPGNAFINQNETATLSFATDGKYRGRFDSDGTFELGNNIADGEFELYRNGSTGAVIHGYPISYGGRFDVQDEAGNVAIKLEADSAGEGGRIWVGQDATPYDDEGIDINGSWGITGEPALRINGTSRDAHFRMDLVGDSSVQLPQDAIGAYEIEDEVGAAAMQTNGFATLTGSYAGIASQTIEAPTAGYALVLVTAQANVSHTTGTPSTGFFGVSTSGTSLSNELDIEVEIDNLVDSGTFKYPVACHSIFSVSAGSNTFYFVGRTTGGAWTVYDYQISVIFIPTEYGTIQLPTALRAEAEPDEAAVSSGPLTPADIAAERAQSEAANRERIERELSEIRTRLVELEGELQG